MEARDPRDKWFEKGIKALERAKKEQNPDKKIKLLDTAYAHFLASGRYKEGAKLLGDHDGQSANSLMQFEGYRQLGKDLDRILRRYQIQRELLMRRN
ncbi:MAG: hypothetical protein V1835_05770 [Candidatus Micrarchaeota archaeon]